MNGSFDLKTRVREPACEGTPGTAPLGGDRIPSRRRHAISWRMIKEIGAVHRTEEMATASWKGKATYGKAAIEERLASSGEYRCLVHIGETQGN